MKSLLPISLAFLSGCSINPGVCDLAPAEDGWKHIENKPSVITSSERPKSGNYFEWFTNNEDLYMRCERPRSGPGCFEEGVFYDSKTGKLSSEQGMKEVVIVCGM